MLWVLLDLFELGDLLIDAWRHSPGADRWWVRLVQDITDNVRIGVVALTALIVL